MEGRGKGLSGNTSWLAGILLKGLSLLSEGCGGGTGKGVKVYIKYRRKQNVGFFFLFFFFFSPNVKSLQLHWVRYSFLS